MRVHFPSKGAFIRVAHVSRVLVSASRRNSLSLRGAGAARNVVAKVRDREDAFASTRDAYATRITPHP
jgi:hypothetical protein